MTSGHDADPVINPSADRAEVLRLGCVVPAHLLDARLGRRQLLPQRGNFTPSGLAKIFGDDAGVVSRHWPAEWLTAVSIPLKLEQYPERLKTRHPSVAVSATDSARVTG